MSHQAFEIAEESTESQVPDIEEHREAMENLFIVGAQRSGSTYLYHLLDEHPQIGMAQPVRPEPKYFLSEDLFEKGREFYEGMYFSNTKPGALYRGEKSTSYIESPLAARRIRAYYPAARILLILRDPVSRAYSNYCFSRENGLETLDFSEALAVEAKRNESQAYGTSVSPFSYRGRGFYMEYINSYLEVFDSAQLKVLILEEIASSLEDVRSLYRWLGVEPDFRPACLNTLFNSAVDPGGNENRCFRELAMGYRASIDELEKYLGRPLEAWRRHHHQICEIA